MTPTPRTYLLGRQQVPASPWRSLPAHLHTQHMHTTQSMRHTHNAHMPPSQPAIHIAHAHTQTRKHTNTLPHSLTLTHATPPPPRPHTPPPEYNTLRGDLKGSSRHFKCEG
jgi:hypothetical protein